MSENSTGFLTRLAGRLARGRLSQDGPGVRLAVGGDQHRQCRKDDDRPAPAGVEAIARG